MGISLKNVVVGLFAITGAVSAFACGGTDAQIPEGSVGTDESLLKEGACIGDSMGGATSCKSAETWKQYAADACKAKGLELSDLSLGGVCKDGFTDAKFACCKVAPVPVPPKPGPEPVACFGDAQGGPTSCKSSATWKQYASDACKAKGSVLTQIGYAEECGKDLYRWTKYECCDATKPPPPPPPPPVCKTVELGDKTSCKPDATWKEYAFNFCVDNKMRFNDMSLGLSCGKDLSQSVKVTCCADPTPPPPPPPPPPPSCDDRYFGDATSCKDPATWKQYAYDACTKDGLTLGYLGFPDAKCGPAGETASVKFRCCK